MFNNLSKALKKMKENVYIYKLDEDFSYETSIPVDKRYSFNGFDGNELMRISKEGVITIRSGYKWDGCSPKIKVFDWFYLGTPDGTNDKEHVKSRCYYGTLIHDPCYKFYRSLPYTRKQVDKFMVDLFRKSGFSLAGLYHRVVRMLGWIFWL